MTGLARPYESYTGCRPGLDVFTLDLVTQQDLIYPAAMEIIKELYCKAPVPRQPLSIHKSGMVKKDSSL